MAEVHSNNSHSKKDSNSNEDYRTEQKTYMATQGASLTPSNGVNVCGASLSSMRDQLRNDLNINNSPKAMTTNSHLSHEKQNKN